MSKRKPKVEAPKKHEVTWTIIGEEFHDSWPTRDEAVNWAKANPPEGKWRIAKMVPADPRRDAELKALRKLADAAAVRVKAEPGSDPFGDAENALANAVAAVEKMQRSGK